MAGYFLYSAPHKQARKVPQPFFGLSLLRKGKYMKQTNISHHESHTRLHNIWCDVGKRCTHHERYAGRGISRCKEWDNYETFAKWARENGYNDGLTLERINVNGNYCPENCKWIPLAEQARNRRTTFWVEYNGRKMSLAEAAEIAKLPYKQVHFRIKQGWSIEKALSTPLKKESEIHKKCKEIGINYHTVYTRIHQLGWDEEKALNTPVKTKTL